MAGKGIIKTVRLLFMTRLKVILFFVLVSYGLFSLTDGYTLQPYVAFLPALIAVQIFLSDFLRLYLEYEVRVGRRWFNLLIAPGTILHELSHLFAAVFTGCYITQVSLFKPNPRTGLLGFVEYTQPRDKWVVFRNFLVGFAPFFGCGLILLILQYFISGGEYFDLDAIQPNSFAQVVAGFTGMGFTHLGKIILNVLPNPHLWILAYLQFCFALGAAASTQDIKIFLKSLIRHPISTLFILFLTCLLFMIVEADIELSGYSLQEAFLLLVSAVVLILSYSIIVLASSIPIVYLGDKFIEIRFSERLITFSIASITYVVAASFTGLSREQSVTSAIAVFILIIAFFKNKRIFLK